MESQSAEFENELVLMHIVVDFKELQIFIIQISKFFIFLFKYYFISSNTFLQLDWKIFFNCSRKNQQINFSCNLHQNIVFKSTVVLIKTPRKDTIKSQSMCYTHARLRVFSVILDIFHNQFRKFFDFFPLQKGSS